MLVPVLGHFVSAHRCLADRACRNAEIRDGAREGAVTTEPDTLCPPCLTYFTKAVGQLPKDWSALRAALGERAPAAGQLIRSTPTPAMPISARKEALMADIVDVADHAADIVSEALHTDRSSGLRKPPADAEPGSVAWNAAEDSRAEPAKTLAAAIRLVEPNVHLLAAAPAQVTLGWASPRRCDTHADMIEAAEVALAAAFKMPELETASRKQLKAFLRRKLKADITVGTEAAERLQALEALRSSYHAAGMCNDCGGWSPDPRQGQARETIETTGIDVLLRLAELHNQTRAELGKTRLRHAYAMPCPHCGGRIGRDDGTTVCDCENCGRSWTEREYKLLAGLIADEQRTLKALQFWLAEAYWRLDTLADAADIIRKAASLDSDPRSGRTVLAVIDDVLAAGASGHQRAAARAISTNRESAEQRQADQDNWAWTNESPYRPPRRKRRRVTKPSGPPIAAASLSTLIDIDEDAAMNGSLKCGRCNLVHRGDCP